jgi:hypothetical protein
MEWSHSPFSRGDPQEFAAGKLFRISRDDLDVNLNGDGEWALLQA